MVFPGFPRSLGVVETHIGPATRALATCQGDSGRVGTYHRHRSTSPSGPSSQAMLKLSYKSLGRSCAFPGFQLAFQWPVLSKPNGSQSKAIWMDKCSIFPSVEASGKLESKAKPYFWFYKLTTLKSKHKCVKK